MGYLTYSGTQPYKADSLFSVGHSVYDVYSSYLICLTKGRAGVVQSNGKLACMLLSPVNRPNSSGIAQLMITAKICYA